MRAFWDSASTEQILQLLEGLAEAWDLYANETMPDSARDLFEKIQLRLSPATPSLDSRRVAPSKFSERFFAVSFSFPGTERPYVSKVASRLATELGKDQVFYDFDYQAHLARPDLDTILQGLYRNRSGLVVVFLAAGYADSDWCGLEWRAVRDIIKSKQGAQIMFVRFDKTPIEGTFGIDGYIDATAFTPNQTADMILERVADGTK